MVARKPAGGGLTGAGKTWTFFHGIKIFRIKKPLEYLIRSGLFSPHSKAACSAENKITILAY
jgi:hypothetical protein